MRYFSAFLVVCVLLLGGCSHASSHKRILYGAHGSGVVKGTSPANTVLPSISGTAEEGSTLTASTGTWERVSSFTYEWQDCNTSGAECSKISGATLSIYAVASSDVGHQIRVVVTGHNSSGAASATSSATATVKAKEGIASNCFEHEPHLCGYPDSTNTGLPEGTSLTASASINAKTENQVISGKEITGNIVVEAKNVTIEKDTIETNGTQKGCTKPCGGVGIRILNGFTGTIITHTTIHGGAATGENALQHCIKNEGGQTTTITYVYGYHCSLGWGAGTWENDYCPMNYEIPEEHYECVYYGGGEGNATFRHNTFFNPQEQTADLFLSVDFGNQEEDKIENNFFAGGGYMVYGGGKGTGGKVIGPVVMANNRAARCKTKLVPGGGGSHVCEGGPDVHGYFPLGGAFGKDAYFNEEVSTFSHNFWDDNPSEEW